MLLRQSHRPCFLPCLIDVTDLSGAITLQTTMNKTYRIPISGVGKLSPSRLSHSLVKFGAAVVGETLISSVYLTNVSGSAGALGAWLLVGAMLLLAV